MYISKENTPTSPRKSLRRKKMPASSIAGLPIEIFGLKVLAEPRIAEYLMEGRRALVRTTAEELGLREFTAARLLHVVAIALNREQGSDVVEVVDWKKFAPKAMIGPDGLGVLDIRIGSEAGGTLLSKVKYGEKTRVGGLAVTPSVDSMLLILETLSFASAFEVSESDLNVAVPVSRIDSFLEELGITRGQLPLDTSEYTELEAALQDVIPRVYISAAQFELRKDTSARFVLYGSVLDPDSVNFDATTDLVGEEYRHTRGVNVAELLISTMREQQGNGWILYSNYQGYRGPNSLTLLTGQSLEDQTIHVLIKRLAIQIPDIKEYELLDMLGNGPILVSEYVGLEP